MQQRRRTNKSPTSPSDAASLKSRRIWPTPSNVRTTAGNTSPNHERGRFSTFSATPGGRSGRSAGELGIDHTRAALVGRSSPAELGASPVLKFQGDGTSNRWPSQSNSRGGRAGSERAIVDTRATAPSYGTRDRASLVRPQRLRSRVQPFEPYLPLLRAATRCRSASCSGSLRQLIASRPASFSSQVSMS